MKTNHFAARYAFLIVAISGLFSASSLQAQFLMSQEKPSASPVSLEASMYPITNTPATIKLNFNNRAAGGVVITIRNEKGHKVYEEFEKTAFYRRRFDLSLMPAGKYTVELSNKSDHISQAFTIEPPTQGYISMESAPAHKTNPLPVDKKLIVSY